MTIQLKDWKLIRSSFDSVEREAEDKNFELSYYHTVSEEEKKVFYLVFKVNISNANYAVYLEMKYRFMLDQEVTDDFLASKFVKINAPAIAFPYLRAYISNMTLQAGYSPVILPSLNFVEMAKQKEKEAKADKK